MATDIGGIDLIDRLRRFALRLQRHASPRLRILHGEMKEEAL